MKTRIIGLVLILSFTAILLAFNLRSWPAAWYDEGIILQASKNVALSNGYGIQSSDGFRFFDPIITTGPTVVLPVASLFKLAGIDLVWGRAIILLFSVMTVLAFFLVCESVFDTKTAFVASLFLLTSTAAFEDISGSFIALSRMVMGEVPAVFFMLAGSLLWFRGIEKNRSAPLVGSGILFGLAALTKTQHILTIAVFFVIFVIDRIRHRSLRLHQVIIPPVLIALSLVLWNLYQLYSVDPALVDAANISSRTGSYVTIVSLPTMIRSARVLLASGVLVWGIPGLVYGVFLCTDRNMTALKRCFLLCLSGIYFAWFLFGSIGWIRYAFPAIVLANIFIAKLLVDLAGGFRFLEWFRRRGKIDRAETIDFVKSLSVAIAIVLMMLIPLQIRLVDISRSQETASFEFARFLDENIPAEAIIESTETEIVFLSDRNFHQPGIDVAIAAIGHVQFGEPYPDGFYDLASHQPDYIVLGPQAKWTQLYTRFLKGVDYELVRTIGDYDLIRIR